MHEKRKVVICCPVCGRIICQVSEDAELITDCPKCKAKLIYGLADEKISISYQRRNDKTE